MKALAAAILLALAIVPASAADLSGRARAIDGDTIHIGDRRIRIWGIAAPELHEPGGREAKTYMAELVALGRVSCIDSGGRSHNRIVAMCSVRRLDLGAEMVGSGLARDCPAFSGGIYGPIEMIAPRRVAYDLPGYCDRQ